MSEAAKTRWQNTERVPRQPKPQPNPYEIVYEGDDPVILSADEFRSLCQHLSILAPVLAKEGLL
jgi:hypothetical protein